MNEMAIQELYQIVSVIDDSHVSIYPDKRCSYFRIKNDAVESLIRMCKDSKLEYEDFKITKFHIINCVSNGSRYYFKLEPFHGDIR